MEKPKKKFFKILGDLFVATDNHEKIDELIGRLKSVCKEISNFSHPNPIKKAGLLEELFIRKRKIIADLNFYRNF